MTPTEPDDSAAGDVFPAVGDSGEGADPFARSDPPLYAVTVWPHRSLDAKGMRRFLGLLAAGFCLPMMAVWGSPAAWALAPFPLAALGLTWATLAASRRQGRLTEELRLWPDAIAVERREPRGRVLRWSANPYWVRVTVADTPRIPRYLTLRGAGRTIELGAFLTAEERVTLAAEIDAALRRAMGAKG